VSRRDFQERLQKGESLRLHETLYCLMQGYDAYALKCDVQIGGYDQHFNMLAGRWVQEHFGQKPHIVWTFPLLMGTDGRKMSKSFGNTINILDTPDDMYGKGMRISDDLLPSYIDLTTKLLSGGVGRPQGAAAGARRQSDGGQEGSGGQPRSPVLRGEGSHRGGRALSAPWCRTRKSRRRFPRFACRRSYRAGRCPGPIS